MRTVLITGAGKGFGRALFEVFSTRGWTTFPLLRDPALALELQSSAAASCHPIVADVTSDHVSTAISEALSRHTQSLDLLINNAGNIRKTPGVLPMTEDELEEHFRVHCTGVFRCVKAAFPYLRAAPRPLVINITSRKGSIALVADEPLGRAYAYKIAKCAQNMLTVCLDKELRQYGIRVFPVHPGRLMTEVAPPDADTPPIVAARKLADWVDSVDRESPPACLDLMTNSLIPW